MSLTTFVIRKRTEGIALDKRSSDAIERNPAKMGVTKICDVWDNLALLRKASMLSAIIVARLTVHHDKSRHHT